MEAVSASSIRELFSPKAGLTFADSATYGLPPNETVAKVSEALAGWQAGTARWVEEWDMIGETCREAFADICGGRPDDTALVPAASVGCGLIAASLEAGTEVLVAEGDFTSLLFPFLLAKKRGVRVREAPLDDLISSIGPETELVAVSWVHSATGAAVDLEALRVKCQACGTRVLLDVTQGLGAVSFDFSTSGADYIVCAAYKFLLCPRGVAFFHVRPELQGEIEPLLAGWKAADHPYDRFYGGPLTLKRSAARFDLSLAWHAWVGAAPSLNLLRSLDPEDRHRLSTAPAKRLAENLGLPVPSSSIVSVPIDNAERLQADLESANVRLAVRAGLARASFHIYNTVEDADRVAEVLSNRLILKGA